ncbi:phosphopantetheine-binding protein [Roseobacteraceae bacterium S113]
MRADIARGLAKIWSDTLGVADIQTGDNFFDLGGHSLLAVQAHREIRTTLGADKLSIADVFGYPTLGGLADRIAALHPGLSAQAPANSVPEPAAVSAAGGARADKRRDAMARRREMRARRQK